MIRASAKTIYAPATPLGKGGVAIIRISGPAAIGALKKLGVKQAPHPRLATLANLTADGVALDRALILTFPAPHSFTGEDVVELHLHGGVAVMKSVLAALGNIDGLRLAEPGEFSRRAFLNDKMDLVEAEGLADLIDAQTTAQHKQAMRQLGGEASARVANLREQVLTPLALLEAYIDFPDEEIPEEVLAETTQRVHVLAKEIQGLLNDGSVGEKIREGLEIVILGPPNAGKSSLLNALSKRDAAIVSPEPGTTRDMVEAHLEIGGFEVTLIDTAGLRETSGAIEAEGIRRARARGVQADFKLVLLDATTAARQFDEVKKLLDENALLLLTKADLGALPALPSPALLVSTVTGQGMEALIGEIRDRVATLMGSSSAPIITRTRHREALSEALSILDGWDIEKPLELACEELRAAGVALGKITGKIWVDDVLDLVFSRFCIGK